MINPVEFNGVIQRAQDVTQLKHNELTKPQTDQANIQMQFHKQIEHNSEQVVKYQASDKKENRFDAKEKGNGNYFSKKNNSRKKKDEKDDELDSGNTYQGIDIRI